MLKISNLTKTFGARILFEEVSFSLSSRERLGLCGRNGCGKSTLFKLILDQEHPDDGQLSIPKGYRIGHLAQHLEFHEENILKEVCLGLPEDERHLEYKAEIMLAGLGFSEDDFVKPASAFSGGFQIRLNLAKLLLSEPDLLLLDEPTNYLDIVSIRWLTGFLRAWRGELILISHDRSFMDAVVTHCMLIHRGAIRKVQGDTEKLYQQVAQDEEIYEKTRVNTEKKRKDLEQFINRFRAQASKAALVQSKIKALERMGQSDELTDIEALDFQFSEAPFPGKYLLECKNISFAYQPGATLVDNLNLVIEKRDRICVIGKNGKGKSTLLRLIAGELTPQDGSVVVNDNTRIGYFGQSNIARLDPKLTIEQEVGSVNPDHSRTKVRAICGTMMFSGDDALKKVSVLSGGEKSRVLLGKLLAAPSNLLLLDEPTNHLDMESIDALMDSLDAYQGAVIIVTHSETLLKRLAKKLIVFGDYPPRVLDFDYDYFLDKEGWGDDEEMSSSKSNKASKKPMALQDPKELARIKREVTELEKQIARKEAQLKEIQDLLVDASVNAQASKINDLSKRLKEIQESMQSDYARWEKLSETVS
jgi:ATP-binding cassette subfamily F protein 3